MNMESVQSAPESDGLFLTNRCSKCGRALTKLEILERVHDARLSICPCGSNKFHSSNFKWWEELFLVRSWRAYFAWKKGLLAPPPTAQSVAGLRRSMISNTRDLIDCLDDETEFEDAREQLRNVN